MSNSQRISHLARWLLPLCAASCLVAGCKGLRLRDAHEDDSAAVDETAADSDSASDTGALSAGWKAALDDPHWVQATGPSPPHRWRHALIEAELAATAGETRPVGLRAALEAESSVVQANAAIALARSGQEPPIEPMLATIRDRQLPLPLRLAAAETLGRQASTKGQQSLRELLDEYGRFGKDFQTQYVPELHAELVFAVGRTQKPSHAAIVAALGSPSALPRLEAARLWAADRQEELPEALVDLRADPDARVRASALTALASHRHAQAAEYLQAALEDYDLNVRRASVAALGMLGDDQSRQRLEQLLKNDAEVIRAEAVAALAAMEADDAIATCIDDKSWRVRAEIAKAMANRPDSPLAALAGKLLSDPSPVVQEQTVAAIGNWPKNQAVPLLLDALANSAYLARKAARQQLVRHWPEAEEFGLDAPAGRRAEMLAQLRQRWIKEHPVALASFAAPAADDEPAPAAAPASSEVLSCLKQLGGESVDERRRAADRLLELSAEAPLAEAVVERLADTVLAESDALVWRSLLAAVAQQSSRAAFRLVYAASSHPAAEVRRRCCEYMARHADPRHANVLVPSLSDEDTSVVRLAARALGASGASEHAFELEPLLQSSDKEVRLEAAMSLTRLGSPQGPAALERLAFDSDPAIRRQAALAMGQLRDRAFIGVLIQLLDDQGGVCQASLASLAEIAGQDAPRSDDATQSPPSPVEAIERWKEWAAQQPDLPSSIE